MTGLIAEDEEIVCRNPIEDALAQFTFDQVALGLRCNVCIANMLLRKIWNSFKDQSRGDLKWEDRRKNIKLCSPKT